MTVVYHVETHRNPRQIERLVRTLLRGAPDALVVVDHDRSFESPDPTVLAGLGAVLRLSPGGYGDMSHVQRWMATAHWLEREGVEYSWLSNLTGQDYPVRPMADIHRNLEETDADAFIQTFEVMDEEQTRWGVQRGRTRYEFNHHRVARLSPRGQRVLRPLQAVNLVQPWVRVTTSTGLAIGLRDRSPFGNDLVLRGGSFFCTLSRLAVESVLRFSEARPDVAEHLSGSIAPDEVYLQTALGWAVEHDPLAKSLHIDGDCKRYFDFSESSFNHPRTFTPADVPTVLGSGADFARKFDEARYPGVLDLIDTAVEGELT
jgi:Core-2/I-Branching enzyme